MTIKNQTQRLSSYKAGSGQIIYEIEQYNQSTDRWYIVGDCSANKKLITTEIELHNLKLNL